jgi:chemotaxis protein MotB
MIRDNIRIKKQPLAANGGWRLDNDIDFAADLPFRQPSAAVAAVVPSSYLPFVSTLGLSLFLHTAVLYVALPTQFAAPSAPQLAMVELALETEAPSTSEPKDEMTEDTAPPDHNPELQALQGFHASALERAAAVEERLSRALTQQAETAAAHQHQLASLEATHTALNDQLETLTVEKADLAAQLESERQRSAELEQQLQEQTRTKEAEVSGVKGAYDRLVAELQGEISQKEIALHRVKEKLSVAIVDRILFPSGQATLTPEGQRLIEKVGAALAKVSDRRILIEGHTDNVPIRGTLRATFPSNWELSTARATEVVKSLIAQGKLPANRLSAVGRADTAPVASNDNEAGRMQNRRIEIILLPPEEQAGGLS